MRRVSNAAAFGLRPSAGRARLLLLVLLVAACSYDAENASIFIHVNGIPATADHLNVVVTPSDTSVSGKNNCGTEVTVPANATCYRPSFQPDALAGGALDLAFSAPASSGTFTAAITASDKQLTQLAQGSIPTTPLPGPVQLQVTLH